MTPDRWVDLGLNLVSEIFGILVTVLLIDRIIKRREESRWKPAKHIVHYKLVEIISQLFTTVIPHYVHNVHIESNYVIYQFGEVFSVPIINMSSIDIEL